jgi:hypothetical protein
MPAHAMEWGMIAVGLGMLIVATDTAWQCLRAGSWPTVPGEILHSHLEDQTIDDSDSGTRTRYKPWIRYRYTARGREFIGHRVSFGLEWHFFEWTAQRVADRFYVGRRVRVHVSPSDPSESSLEAGVTLPAILLFAGGLALIVAGAWP